MLTVDEGSIIKSIRWSWRLLSLTHWAQLAFYSPWIPWCFFCQQAACLPWYNIYRLVFHTFTPRGPQLLTPEHLHTHTDTHTDTHNLSSDAGGGPQFPQEPSNRVVSCNCRLAQISPGQEEQQVQQHLIHVIDQLPSLHLDLHSGPFVYEPVQRESSVFFWHWGFLGNSLLQKFLFVITGHVCVCACTPVSVCVCLCFRAKSLSSGWPHRHIWESLPLNNMSKTEPLGEKWYGLTLSFK